MFENFVNLPEPVPRAVVPFIDVNCPPVRLDGRGSFPHLHKLVAHEGPRAQELAVELERSLKVLRGPCRGCPYGCSNFRRCSKTSGRYFVNGYDRLRQRAQFSLALLHVQNVTEDVDHFHPDRPSVEIS